MRRRYYVSSVIHFWCEQETTLGLPVAATMMDGSYAYMPVFDSIEAAQAAYPGATVIEIEADAHEMGDA